MGNFLKKSKNRKFKDVYIQEDILGRGSYGSVYEAKLRKDPSKVYAAKIIRLEHLSKIETMKATKDEVTAMQQLDHPNIVKLIDVFQSKRKLVLILEYCKGGTLFDHLMKIKHYSEKDAVEIALQLAKAVQHMHSRGVVHRDLKPENILYETKDPQSAIKLTDFGLSKYLHGNNGRRTMLSACGTPNFVAPEIVLKKPYNEKVDIWSIGIILYVILSGHLPFYSKDLQTLLAKIAKGKFHFRPAPFKKVSAYGKIVLQRIICANPAQRPDASELVELLEKYKKQANKDVELKMAKENLRKLNLKQKLRRGLTALVGLEALIQVHEGKKKFKTVCGQLFYVDAHDTKDRRLSDDSASSSPCSEKFTPPKATQNLFTGGGVRGASTRILVNKPDNIPISPKPIIHYASEKGL